MIGLINFKKGNYTQALIVFKETVSLLPFAPLTHRADFIESLALTYYNSGDLDASIQEYEKIIQLTMGRLWYGDIYATSFYMLGKIYEEKRLPLKAIEQYEKFLELWKEADKDLHELKDAKSRLKSLVGKI